MTEPLYIVLFLTGYDDRWQIYNTSENIEEATYQFETAKEDSGIEGEFRLIESEIIRNEKNKSLKW